METGEQTGNNGLPEKILVKIGNVEVDFTVVKPITGGDKKKLFKEYGINFSRVTELDPEGEQKLILFFVRKLHPQATEAEVEELDLGVQQDIVTRFVRASRDAVSPFRPRSSTSSAPSTGGASASSQT